MTSSILEHWPGEMYPYYITNSFQGKKLFVKDYKLSCATRAEDLDQIAFCLVILPRFHGEKLFLNKILACLDSTLNYEI